MTREELLLQPVAALVELVLQQQAKIVQLEAMLDARATSKAMPSDSKDQRIAELEAQLAQARATDRKSVV